MKIAAIDQQPEGVHSRGARSRRSPSMIASFETKPANPIGVSRM